MKLNDDHVDTVELNDPLLSESDCEFTYHTWIRHVDSIIVTIVTLKVKQCRCTLLYVRCTSVVRCTVRPQS